MPRVYLVELLLPLYDNEGRRHPRAAFARVREELVDKFGGLTAHTRAPAEGLWEDAGGAVTRDDVVLFEVMADALDADWWGAYRATLEARFRQEAVLVRAHEVRRL